MTWQTLLTANRVQRHTTSRKEIEDLRALVARDLRDAGLPDLSADRRFATAYNAILQTGKMVAACAGYRVVGPGHHRTMIEAIELAMGKAVSPQTAYFETCRRKRNTLDYDLAGVVSDQESDEIVREALRFRQRVEMWIAQHHSQYRRKEKS
jgi:hypothetical protein